MELQKIEIKFFAVEREPVPLSAFIDLFHGWIQASDGVYHDVADYSHMHQGPGIVLVAPDFYVSVDETGGRRGFLFSQKAPLEGTNQERLARVFQSALENCRRLQAEPALQRKIEFRFDEFEITFNDRLLAANGEESYQALKAEIEPFVSRLFGGAPGSLQQESDARRRVRLRIQATAPVDLAALLSHVGVWANGQARIN
ncbi:MAG: hypothetical protein Q8S00_27920 [Deltaproteobacteria bacterium]|nr:hypothetical protein [Deltaproteobacteria bacterium]MDZ4344625.1 hypothetical protein [Candidatus Binatia bacterium]